MMIIVITVIIVKNRNNRNNINNSNNRNNPRTKDVIEAWTPSPQAQTPLRMHFTSRAKPQETREFRGVVFEDVGSENDGLWTLDS